MSCKYCKDLWSDSACAPDAVCNYDSSFTIGAHTFPDGTMLPTFFGCPDQGSNGGRFEYIGTFIDYCPWCGRDLCCDDEPEPNDGKAQAETATPDYYIVDGVEAIDVIERVCELARIPARALICLANLIKYVLRAGRKGGTEADFKSDCQKAANYACRMVTGRWLDQDGGAHE